MNQQNQLERTALFTGATPALILPMHARRTNATPYIDWDAFEMQVYRQKNAGTTAFLANGTTGECATMDPKEESQTIQTVRSIIGPRQPDGTNTIIGGITCANDTLGATLDSAFRNAEAGADMQMLCAPYYNKTSQRGLLKIFNAITDRVDLPLMTYNVPGRTNMHIKPETLAELYNQNPLFMAHKEANSDQFAATAAALNGKVAWYSGEDAQNYDASTLGAIGYISVAQNAFPEHLNHLYQLCAEGNWEAAEAFQAELYELCVALFPPEYPSPSGIKALMAEMNLCEETARLPVDTLESGQPERERLAQLGRELDAKKLV